MSDNKHAQQALMNYIYENPDNVIQGIVRQVSEKQGIPVMFTDLVEGQ